MSQARLGLRARLAILSLSVLLIPYFGYSYLRDTERHLRAQLAQTLAATASNIASVMAAHGDRLPASGHTQQGDSLYVHRLVHEVQVDGFQDDWELYLDWGEHYGSDGLVDTSEGSSEAVFALLLGQRGKRLYGLVRVIDDTVVYARGVHLPAGRADRISLLTRDSDGAIRRYHFSSAGPGPVVAYERELDETDMVVTRSVNNIHAQWQPAPEGYTLEFTLPLTSVGDSLAIVVEDVDEPGQAPRKASTSSARNALPGPLLLSRPEFDALLSRTAVGEGRRSWLLDRGGQVLASAGSLKRGSEFDEASRLLGWILPPVSENFTDELAGASRLRSPEVQSALRGQAQLRWRSSPDGRAVIVSAAEPVMVDQRLAAVVVVEQTTGGIQSVQREATLSLFSRALTAFAIVITILLGFATWLSLRLRRLSRATDAAIDAHGRVVGMPELADSNDEIGDLARNFSRLLRRLGAYNEYLEGMAGRLAHELRTPMAVVRSSLENLDRNSLSEEDRAYLERAQSGVLRLQGLVARLAEAARLEQALASAEPVSCDLVALLADCVAGYSSAQSDVRADLSFRFDTSLDRLDMTLATDLIVQMLDKLVDNAVGFASADSSINIALHTQSDAACISVTNHGPTLPPELSDTVFNSMVSIREGDRREQPHLGLGLYLVRLIAEFHDGEVSAHNLEDGTGVSFQVRIPIRTSGRADRDTL